MQAGGGLPLVPDSFDCNAKILTKTSITRKKRRWVQKKSIGITLDWWRSWKWKEVGVKAMEERDPVDGRFLQERLEKNIVTGADGCQLSSLLSQRVEFWKGEGDSGRNRCCWGTYVPNQLGEGRCKWVVSTKRMGWRRQRKQKGEFRNARGAG